MSTTTQTFSAVITGGFEYDSVSTNQQIDKNNSEKPATSFLSYVLGSSYQITEFQESVFYIVVCCCIMYAEMKWNQK